MDTPTQDSKKCLGFIKGDLNNMHQQTDTVNTCKYCRHTTLNSVVQVFFSDRWNRFANAPCHLCNFWLGFLKNLESVIPCRFFPCSRESVLQGTRDLGSKLPSPTEVDTSASASVAVLADAPSRSPTELVESRSLEEGSHFPQTVSTLPDRQLPVEIFDEYLFQSEDQEVEEYF